MARSTHYPETMPPAPDWLANALTGLAVVLTGLPFVRRDAWWIRAWAFPRVQLLAFSVAALAVALLAAGPGSTAWLTRVAAATVSAAVQALYILPFTPLWKRQVKSASGGARPALSVLIANVLMANREASALCERVRELRPDLLLLVETDAWWRDALTQLRADYPHAIEEPLGNTYGMLLYSRLPLRAAEVRYLVEPDVPSVRCRIAHPEAGEVVFVGLHPRPPVPHEAPTTSARDAELLLVARELEGGSGPAIVAGDLNDVAWSYTTRLFRRVSGLLDPRIGRGLYTTFPADRPWLRFPLDHIFHSAHFVLERLSRPNGFGSDHLPIFARLVYRPGARPRREPEPADTREIELAEEKIDRGLY